jgi:hypothetical protein
MARGIMGMGVCIVTVNPINTDGLDRARRLITLLEVKKIVVRLVDEGFIE